MKKKLLFIMLLVLPSVVLAASGADDELPILVAIGMEAFVSIHMSLFVLMPLSNIFSKDRDSKKLFWKLFWIRVAVLLFFDIFVTTFIALADFIFVFIGAAIIVPICSAVTKKAPFGSTTKNKISTSNDSTQNNTADKVILTCVKCGSVLTVNHKFCTKCGEAFSGDNVKVEVNKNSQKRVVSQADFDVMYTLSEDEMVEHFILNHLKKANIDENSKLVPSDVLRKKQIFNIIFSVLVFIYISLIFFHFPLATYVIGIIILLIFFKLTRGYNLIKYLKKQLKARPSEKVSNIVMSLKTNLIEDTSKKSLLIGLASAIIISALIFIKPVILYEKVDDSYAVRYYAFGITNFTKATIPEKHKGKNVVSLRGNTFSNMPFLKEVILPDTIVEIRGQAFKNDRSLRTVKLPSKLGYLGGGAFYNCTSLASIEIPDGVSYLGGESFYNAKSLQSVKLPKNLKEVRGSTFENCTSLISIEIPDSVTRIGGHAFYNNRSLTNVFISENSKLEEIGSSAFRLCHKLTAISLPYDVYVNERAFKESPTEIYYYGNYEYDYDSETNYDYNY